MTLANAKSVNRQTLENVVRNAASEFTRRTAIASLASLSFLAGESRTGIPVSVLVPERVEGATGIGATGLRGSERKSASERVSEREDFRGF